MKIKIPDAEFQVESERWKCESCDYPIDDRYDPYCMACGIYYKEDASSAVFQEDFKDFDDGHTI